MADDQPTQESVDDFLRRHEVLNNALKDHLRGATDAAPEMLYHYTSAEAALKIVETGQLRATHASFLNDSSEFQYGTEKYSEVLKKIKNSPSHGTRARKFLDSHAINELLTQHSTAFAFCLSAEGNQLSQWRAYSGHHTGYSLGFDPDGLKKM